MIIETNEGYNPQMERIIASRSFPIGSKVKNEKSWGSPFCSPVYRSAFRICNILITLIIILIIKN